MPDCDARKEQAAPTCNYHICILEEGHKGMHQCACGFCWED